MRSACEQSNGLKSLSRLVQGKTKANGKVYIVRCGLKEAARSIRTYEQKLHMRQDVNKVSLPKKMKPNTEP